ncbi:DUF4936 domain-containing protein [Massilia phosphatilytica]|nr:DUF4936 domain-containing protein [Massilia phosphatilytica]
MIDLYVYYKVRELDAAALVPRVRALQDSVGVPSQLKRRPDVRDGLQTWMEVYPDVDDGFPARLDAAARTAGFEGLIEGPRRAEIFMDLPTCA